MILTDHSDVARTRLLHVAAAMFTEYGFKATTIRKICERANVNVSMVNYYFRSKEELYLAVLNFARQQEKKLVTHETDVAGENIPATEKLRRTIESMMFNLLKPEGSSIFTRLLAWEMVEPSPAIKFIVESDLKPEHQFFASLIRDIVGDTLNDDELWKCVFSIIGQAVFYAHFRPLHVLVAPQITYDDTGIRQIAEHIYRFSLAALNGLPQLNGEGVSHGVP